jgi:hypothetical protein
MKEGYILKTSDIVESVNAKNREHFEKPAPARQKAF